MPHIEIKCYPGRTEQQKRECAERIAQDAADILGCKYSSVSVSVKDVPAESWKAQVWDRHIVPEKAFLYKAPGYSCEGAEDAQKGLAVLETDRLYLREMTEADYDPLYQILSDSEIMQHYPSPLDEEGVKNWIRRNIERYQTFGFGLWAVCLKESGWLIGDCGLTMQMINGVIRPEIGYHICADQQRKGYAGEAAAAVRDWAFRNTPFQTIYSYMKYTNEPSARTAMRWGCKQVGQYRDDVNEISRVFAVTREEWLRLFI